MVVAQYSLTKSLLLNIVAIINHAALDFREHMYLHTFPIISQDKCLKMEFLIGKVYIWCY